MAEQEIVTRVQGRIRDLGLPEPKTEFAARSITFDLAWPEQRTAVEISQSKRPANADEWTVGSINATMSDDQIDTVLKTLPL